MIETRQLLLIQTVASTGSYSAAGRELGLTQPAISYQMRRLEQQVGTALAVRRGRLMSLTAAGVALVAQAERVLATLRAAEEEMGLFAGRDVGEVRIASFPSASATLVADAIAAATALMPSVTITHVQAEPSDARRLVRRGEADIAVTYKFDPSPFMEPEAASAAEGTLHHDHLLRDDLWVALPSGHPAAKHPRVRFEELKDETWHLASPRFDAFVRNLAATQSTTPHISLAPDDYVTVQALVARRLGVAVIPGLGLAAHQNPRVVPRLVEDFPSRLVQMEYWPDLARVPSIASMIALLGDAALRVNLPKAPGTLSRRASTKRNAMKS
ncbi:MAG: transcriptional regulator [Microbacteriaceae bacterium]|nr:transcriptional regulator [Microbacteriaceae bacterium]